MKRRIEPKNRYGIKALVSDIKFIFVKKYDLITDFDKIIDELPHGIASKIMFQNKSIQNKIIILEPSGTIAIIKSQKNNMFILGATLDTKDRFSTKESSISSDISYREAVFEEIIRLQNAFNKENLLWDISTRKALPKKKVKPNQFVRISILGRTIALGVFREINNQGEVVLYFVKKIGDSQIHYSLYENLGKASDCQLENLCHVEQTILCNKLHNSGMVWNGHKSRIETANYQLNNFRFYYYINDLYEIRRKVVDNKRSDQRKFNSGNFFQFKEDARYLVAYLKSINNISRTRVSLMASYYYINNCWSVVKRIERYFVKDSQLYKSGNYFNKFEDANIILSFLVDKRNVLLLKKKEPLKGFF